MTAARLVHIFAAGIMVILVAAFELGGLSPRDAFFGVLSVLVIFTTYKLLNYDGERVDTALRQLVTRPQGRGERLLGYFTFMGVAALGLIVAIQAVSVSV
jgi:hypothetical protein